MITLDDILALVGVLDDAPGDNTARSRFRSYLAKSATTVGVVRDYVEACLRMSGVQYSRALQDLVNHTGQLIGFKVEFGRYQGVTNDIGYDGIWRTEDLALVIEVKTSDAYTINTSTLLGYTDRLIEAGRITDWDHALGLYILGRSDPGITQLEHSIIGQKRSGQLRVATVETILSLAELRQDDFISLDEAVALLKPTTVRVDDIVGILTRIVAQPGIQTVVEPPLAQQIAVGGVAQQPLTAPVESAMPVAALTQSADEPLHLLTPVADDENATARDIIKGLLDKGWYVFGERTTGRKDLKPGDRLCFYESAVGVVAEAVVDSCPERKTIPGVRHADKFPWAFKVRNVRYFFD